jgi:DHA1 family bicyclomycin/chloramphenicol resistance-like MFS transporter
MTLVLFFVFEMPGILFFGPLSDRFGRRPILLSAIGIFIASSIACGLAQDIVQLIAFRIVEAVAAGGIMSLAIALAKDCFDGKDRETVIAITTGIFLIGPVLAPVIGAQALLWFSWRATFVILTLLGLVALGFSLLYCESLPADERLQGSFLGSFKGLVAVAKNRDFMVFMLVATLFNALVFNSYLTVAPFIYEVFFSLTPLEYSYFFGAAAGVSAIGLFIYRPLGRLLGFKRLTTLVLVLSGLSGVATLAFGHLSPFVFFAMNLLFQTVCVMMRPYATNSLLEMQKGDSGAVSSMLNFTYGILGAAGMFPIVLLGGDYIMSIGAGTVLAFASSAILWIWLLRNKVPVPGVTE